MFMAKAANCKSMTVEGHGVKGQESTTLTSTVLHLHGLLGLLRHLNLGDQACFFAHQCSKQNWEDQECHYYLNFGKEQLRRPKTRLG
ncbi:hypothetical protein V6N11_064334 [Hibiscus sabdariffa]|uniref:Uncharacterized protein n=2 Tax=Hibiscus sabdariffa TaxID=183260 RepID=A0ABR2PNC5_9ROSI